MVLVIGILIQTTTLLNFLKVFETWANFVRAVTQIIKSAKTLFMCLAIFVLMQTFMFYIMLQNLTAPPKELNGDLLPTGFFAIMLNSYRFVLGEFNILEYFCDQENPIVFWFIFVVSTLFQVLIFLNMLIAVMTSTFELEETKATANIYKAKLYCLQEFSFKVMRYSGEQFKKPEFLYKI